MHLDSSLQPRRANFIPLTPVDFLCRSVEVRPEKVAVIHEERYLTYRDLGVLVGRLAAFLRERGIGKGDVVSIVSGNRPEMLAAHFAIPMIGAVLNTINTRLDAATVAYILDHSESRLLLADATFRAIAEAAIASSSGRPPLFVFGAGDGRTHLEPLYESLAPLPLSLDGIDDEWQPICINYTSGTTGKPKGVVCHHRGAYLNSLGNVMALGFDERTSYLWVLPMFHCNGWQHPWAVTAACGTHVCLDRVDPALILAAIEKSNITHFCCAPVVLYMLLAEVRDPIRSTRSIRVGTGGAAPTAALIQGLEALGIEIVHLYGLTESYGPATLCALHPDLPIQDPAEKARFLARQGARHPLSAEVNIVSADGLEVPADGSSLGEIAIRSNTLMAGYYKDHAATEAAFAGGYFHTGDLAVRHHDGMIEIKDRSKDLIISGGENISSLEVESALHQHPAVLLAAVVAVPDPKWGEVPCACVELRSGVTPPDANELISFCRARLARFKVPRRIVFCELPKTATGKIQKYALRGRLTQEAESTAGPR